MARKKGKLDMTKKRRFIAAASAAAVGLTVIAGFVAPAVVTSTVASATPVPEQYNNVGEMRAEQPFYVSHRGGSSDWPEFSMSAYANSVAWGMGALELSVSRTSDGVFFGLHDATLNRTSNVTGTNHNPMTMTWQHLTTNYRNKLNAPTAEGVEYTRAEDVFANYARDHVIFVDPKYIGNTQQRTELINLMLSYAPADHWVLKGYHDDPTLGALARQYGIQTWGYYYARDLDEFDQTAGYWDMLGLELQASDAQWQRVKAKGKPVVAFFVDNQAELAEATRKGANGVMVSGVPATLGSPKLQEPKPTPTLLPTPSPSAASVAPPARLRSAVAVNGKRVIKKRKVVKRNIRATVSVPNKVSSSPKIRLQQKVRGKWVTVRTNSLRFANSARVAASFSAKRNVAYRVCTITNTQIIGSCSKSIKVR